MLLAIDVGNTNMVVAVYDGKTLKGQWRLVTDRARTADEYAILLMQLLRLKGLDHTVVKACIIASVVPPTRYPLTKALRSYFSITPLIVGENGVDLGLRVRIDRPQEAGADRLVNSFAAHHLYGGELLVIDFGTATTFDVVNAEGDYLGGIIAPGLNLSMEALHQAAAKLPRIEVRRPEKVIGTNTVNAMQSGLFYGYVGLIEGLIDRVKTERSLAPKVVATGGLAPLFAGATDRIDELAPDLTMEGLRMIYDRYNEKPSL